MPHIPGVHEMLPSNAALTQPEPCYVPTCHRSAPAPSSIVASCCSTSEPGPPPCRHCWTLRIRWTGRCVGDGVCEWGWGGGGWEGVLAAGVDGEGDGRACMQHTKYSAPKLLPDRSAVRHLPSNTNTVCPRPGARGALHGGRGGGALAAAVARADRAARCLQLQGKRGIGGTLCCTACSAQQQAAVLRKQTRGLLCSAPPGWLATCPCAVRPPTAP